MIMADFKPLVFRGGGGWWYSFIRGDWTREFDTWREAFDYAFKEATRELSN